MPPSRIDELLPAYEFSERHTTRIQATPAEAVAAAKAATPAEMPFVRTLFGLRSGPAQVTRGRGLPRDKHRSLVDQMVEFGFVQLAAAEDEIVLGYVGQPWKPAGGTVTKLLFAEAWSAFEEPGYAKALMNFRSAAVPDASGPANSQASLLETETRVHVTDESSRRRFARYWRLIRPWSGLIRRSWLRAAKRRAEGRVP
jgi:hypothetical protein